jgi:hypothetical protein
MRKNIVILTLSFFLIIFGCVITVSEVVDYEVKDNFDDGTLTLMTNTYDLTLNNNTLDITTTFTEEPSIIYDNSMDKGDVKIKVTYYNELMNIDKFVITKTSGDTANISTDDTNNFDAVKKMISVTLNGLRHKEVYNYVSALKPTVKVFINEADKDAVKIRK